MKLIFAVHIKIQCRMQFLPFNKREEKTEKNKNNKATSACIACPIDRHLVSRMVWYAVCALLSFSLSLAFSFSLFASLICSFVRMASYCTSDTHSLCSLTAAPSHTYVHTLLEGIVSRTALPFLSTYFQRRRTSCSGR